MAPFQRNAGRVELGRGFENRVLKMKIKKGSRMHLCTSSGRKDQTNWIGTAHITVVVVEATTGRRQLTRRLGYQVGAQYINPVY